jgi:hypothetical protein
MKHSPVKAAGGADELLDGPAGAASIQRLTARAANTTLRWLRWSRADGGWAGFASDTIPRVRDDRDAGQLVGGHERLDHRQHGLGHGLVALNADTVSGTRAASVSRPMVMCGSRRRSWENPGTTRSLRAGWTSWGGVWGAARRPAYSIPMIASPVAGTGWPSPDLHGRADVDWPGTRRRPHC